MAPEAPDSHLGWHRGHNLPHFDAAKVYQSISYRLADSVPRSTITSFERRLDSLTSGERSRRLRFLIESYADASYGECLLSDHDVARIVYDCWSEGNGCTHHLIAWVIMPNHVHLLIKQVDGFPLGKLVQRWKSGSSRLINRTLGRSGRLWMPDYWDRYVRDHEHFRRVAAYIHDNPVKAGLCSTPSAWPWSSASSGGPRTGRLPTRT